MISFNNSPESTRVGLSVGDASFYTAIRDAVNDYLDEHPVSGADVPTTDIDFSDWENGGIE